MNTLFKCSNCGSFDIVLDSLREKNKLIIPINLVCRSCLHYETLEELEE